MFNEHKVLGILACYKNECTDKEFTFTVWGKILQGLLVLGMIGVIVLIYLLQTFRWSF